MWDWNESIATIQIVIESWLFFFAMGHSPISANSNEVGLTYKSWQVLPRELVSRWSEFSTREATLSNADTVQVGRHFHFRQMLKSICETVYTRTGTSQAGFGAISSRRSSISIWQSRDWSEHTNEWASDMRPPRQYTRQRWGGLTTGWNNEKSLLEFVQACWSMPNQSSLWTRLRTTLGLSRSMHARPGNTKTNQFIVVLTRVV